MCLLAQAIAPAQYPEGSEANWLRSGVMTAWQITGKREKHKQFNFSYSTFTTVFKICLHAKCVDKLKNQNI